MERHRCKLGFKNFVNGRALGGGGVMISHRLTEQPSESPPLLAELDSLSSSSGGEEIEEGDEKGMFGFGLRENIKKSVKLVDPKLSDHQDHHQGAQTGSVVLQDRESETESSKNPNPVRRRSKRVRKMRNFVTDEFLKMNKCPEWKKPKMVVKLSSQTELTSRVDPDQVSSISGTTTTTEEDLAHCLIMLSRDKWHDDEEYYEDQEQEEDEYYEEQTDNESDDNKVKVISKGNKGRGKYRCDTCNKVFKSYQALGGHRASHKKIRLNNNHNFNHNHHVNKNGLLIHDEDREVVVEEKIHECPYCFRVFASGQALGGHKRSHVIGSSTTSLASNASLVHAKPVAKQGEMIDLNMPAPMEDEDEISQIELSAVSDGEFVKIH